MITEYAQHIQQGSGGKDLAAGSWLHSLVGFTANCIEHQGAELADFWQQARRLVMLLHQQDGCLRSHQIQSISRISTNCITDATKTNLWLGVIRWMRQCGTATTTGVPKAVVVAPVAPTLDSRPTTNDWLTELTSNPGGIDFVKEPVGLCPGCATEFDEPVLSHYPFQLHDHMELDWQVPSSAGLHSTKCTGFVTLTDGVGAPCGACLSLRENKELKGVVDRSQDAELYSSTTNDVYLTQFQ